MLRVVVLILCCTFYYVSSVFASVDLAEVNWDDELVDCTNEFKITFEQGEPKVWTGLNNFGELTTKEQGDGGFYADTQAGSGTWRPFLRLDSSQLIFEKDTVYSVEFEYKVLRSPSYFYVFTPTSKGNSILKTFSAQDGYSGGGYFIFKTDQKVDCVLHFAAKLGGAIIIDNISFRKWKSEKLAHKGIKLIDKDKDFFRQKFSHANKKLNGFLRACRDKKNIESFLVDRCVESRLKNLLDSIRDAKATVQNRLYWAEELEDIERYLFKLSVIKEQKKQDIFAKFSVYVDSSLKKIRRDKPFAVSNVSKKVELYSARNESESFQLLVVPFCELSGVNLRFTDLKSIDGKHLILKDNITWKKVEYVETTKELYPVDYIGLWPDPIVSVKELSVPEHYCVQPLWIRLRVPYDSMPGDYQGEIHVLDCGQEVTLPVNLRVWDFALPKKPSLRTSFAARWQSDFYMKNDLIDGSDPVVKQLPRMYRAKLIENRLSPCRIGIEPKTILKKDGSIEIDFSEYDKELDHYLSQDINAFTFGRYWGWASYLKDGNKQDFVVWPEDREGPENLRLEFFTPELTKFMNSYFSQWQDYLEKKGCLDRAYYYIYDEPAEDKTEWVNKILEIAHEAAPELKLIIPGVPELGDTEKTFEHIGIQCPVLNKVDFDVSNNLKKQGQELWWYVCLNPRHPYPNFFVDYPAMDHRILFWMTWKYGVEGLLYWETCFWNHENPWRNPECYPTVHGDGILFYPSRSYPIEVVSTIRLEIIRDGVEDYDYFTVLQKLILKAESVNTGGQLISKAKEYLKVPDDIVRATDSYTLDQGILLNRRIKIAETICELNESIKRAQ